MVIRHQYAETSAKTEAREDKVKTDKNLFKEEGYAIYSDVIDTFSVQKARKQAF